MAARARVDNTAGPEVVRPVFLDPRGLRRTWLRVFACAVAVGSVSFLGVSAAVLADNAPPLRPNTPTVQPLFAGPSATVEPAPAQPPAVEPAPVPSTTDEPTVAESAPPAPDGS